MRGRVPGLPVVPSRTRSIGCHSRYGKVAGETVTQFPGRSQEWQSGNHFTALSTPPGRWLARHFPAGAPTCGYGAGGRSGGSGLRGARRTVSAPSSSRSPMADALHAAGHAFQAPAAPSCPVEAPVEEGLDGVQLGGGEDAGASRGMRGPGGLVHGGGPGPALGAAHVDRGAPARPGRASSRSRSPSRKAASSVPAAPRSRVSGPATGALSGHAVEDAVSSRRTSGGSTPAAQ